MQKKDYNENKNINAENKTVLYCNSNTVPQRMFIRL